jgi:hypothetical protein
MTNVTTDTPTLAESPPPPLINGKGPIVPT